MGIGLEGVESAVRAAVENGSLDRDTVIEMLVAELLSHFLGMPDRATDGFQAIREEITATAYFAVGTVWMIDDQSRLPIWLDLAFSDAASLSGVIRVGLRSGNEMDDRLETRLLAYPHETAAALEWAHEFERRSEGWDLRASTTEES